MNWTNDKDPRAEMVSMWDKALQARGYEKLSRADFGALMNMCYRRYERPDEKTGEMFCTYPTPEEWRSRIVAFFSSEFGKMTKYGFNAFISEKFQPTIRNNQPVNNEVVQVLAEHMAAKSESQQTVEWWKSLQDDERVKIEKEIVAPLDDFAKKLLKKWHPTNLSPLVITRLTDYRKQLTNNMRAN